MFADIFGVLLWVGQYVILFLAAYYVIKKAERKAAEGSPADVAENK